MKKILLLLFLVEFFSSFSQNQKPPTYPTCEEVIITELEQCFLDHLKADFLKEFKLPNDVNEKNYKEKVLSYFTITKTGHYQVNYINSNYRSVKNEIKRVFSLLPKVEPAMYNGRNIERNYIFPLFIPLENNYKIEKEEITIESLKDDISKVVIDENLIQFPELNSTLSIPFTHQQYALIDAYGNQLENEHSSVKPYFYNETPSYKKVATNKKSLYKDVKSFWGKKAYNENLIYIKGDDYWFIVNPIFDLQLGKDNSDIPYTYNNTRAVNVRGSIGKLSFSSNLYESQGRFAEYVNKYILTLKPANSNAVMLGAGNAKIFKDGGFDYPVAEGYISYAPNKHFTLQFGNGKNFIGDGYRSLFLSDAAAPYTFAKISTQFWKIKYTNIWMWMNDVSSENFTDGAYLRKYVAMHHLSINLSKKLNVGLFESTVTNAKSNPNMDVNFINPIIFYRAIEFSRGSKSGNALVGLNTKYKLKSANIYGQFILDEIIVSNIFKNNGYWANKYGFQLGFHYFDAFKIKNLMLQGETNIVRPYTYSHRNSDLSYSHYYQPIAHSWGSNFVELIGIARYQKDRWFGNFKAVIGKKGFDFDGNDASYGGNIFNSYNNRPQTFNNSYYQGNTANIITTDLQLGYIINPTTNLHLFANANYRYFSSKKVIPYFDKTNTTWFSIGIKSDILNSYFDF